MTRFDIIASNSRQVVGNSPSSISVVLEFRRLTSPVTTSPRTYGDWEDFYSLPTKDANQQVYDEMRQEWARQVTQFVRCDDSTPSPRLTQGDQVRTPDARVWAVLGVASSGPGTVLYALGTEEILLGDAARGGGV